MGEPTSHHAFMWWPAVVALLVATAGQELAAGGPGRAVYIDDLQTLYTEELRLPPWTVTVEFWLNLVQVPQPI